MVTVRIVPTPRLSGTELRMLRDLLDEAFEGTFSDDDWDHTIGGVHVIAVGDGIVSHAAVVDRLLVAGDRPFATGYVEGVATGTAHRRRGYAEAVMRAAGEIIRSQYELGGLSTGVTDFYARLGWELWQGPTFTNSPTGRQRTRDEDGTVMILRTERTRDLDLTAPLMCDWRPGDVW